MKTFHLGDLLSITTGRLLAPGHISAIHQLLDYMTGDTLFTHQIPRAVAECAPALLAQYPFLSTIETPEEFDGPEHVERWVAELVAMHGAEFKVEPLDPADHTHIHPLVEMAMNFPQARVIPVVFPDAES